ncbi:hypothetical protein ES703_30455 [subsurface metagenome]
MIFKTGALGQSIAFSEQFFLALLYYKLLSFSRASESIARASSGITQLILILIICAFLLHGMVIYLSAFHNSAVKRSRKEILLFLALAVPAVLAIALLLPADFVNHSMVFNRINKDVRPRPIPLDEWGEGWEGGNLRSDRFWEDRGFRGGRFDDFGEGENGGENGQDGQGESGIGWQNSLEGIPADQWGDQRMGRGGENKQYAVMVVASPVEPVYAADAYFGRFDSVRGFLYSEDEPLNELSYLRLLETWKDKDLQPDRKRYPFDIFYLSTLTERVLAYKPFAVEPTVLKTEFHPFDFSYNTVSRISRSRPRDWLAIEDLSAQEKFAVQSCLEIPLGEPALGVFESHLKRALKGRTGYFERIEAILKSFSDYQYEIGFNDNVHVARLEAFLEHTKRGDCSEFSNTAAILARLAGIPARVVTGYLASRELQTFAHLRAIQVLWEVIEPLKVFPPQNLYLVTTAHRHSWVQFYMPGYGWVDFEATTYALPPPPGGNPNSMDVVIPLIQGERIQDRLFRFPWLFTLRLLLALLAAGVSLIYLYRYGNEIYLRFLARGRNLKALKALYKLLLIRMSLNGYDLKRPAQTALEYAARYPKLERFAALYTRLRYRETTTAEEAARLWPALRESFNQAADCFKQPGLWSGMWRLFSLKGLYYQW